MTPIMSTFIYSPFSFTKTAKVGVSGLEPPTLDLKGRYSKPTELHTHTKRVCSITPHTPKSLKFINIQEDHQSNSLRHCSISS